MPRTEPGALAQDLAGDLALGARGAGRFLPSLRKRAVWEQGPAQATSPPRSPLLFFFLNNNNMPFYINLDINLSV